MSSPEKLTKALRSMKDAISHLHLARGNLDEVPTIADRIDRIIEELTNELSYLRVLVDDEKRPRR